MDKKKIGELEGTPIVTGDKNYANEHEYYMTLNGDNTYQKLEQRTNGDQFRLVLGGSGSGSGCDCGGFKYNELPEPTVVRELTDEDLSRLPSIDYLPANSSYGDVIDLNNGIIPDKLILQEGNNEYYISPLQGINTNGGGAEGVIWVYYGSSRYVVSADGSIMVSLVYGGSGKVVG